MGKQKIIKTFFGVAVLVLGLFMFGLTAKASWEIEVIDDSGGVSGHDNALAVDSLGNPHILYALSARGTSDGYSAIKYTKKTDANWQIETICESTNSDNFACDPYGDIAIDSNDIPHILYSVLDTQSFSNRTLKYAKRVNNQWETEDITDNCMLDEHIANITLDLDSFNLPHIVYKDQTTFGLIYTYKDNSGIWHPENISDGNGYSAIGNAQLILDSDDKPCISFTATDVPEFDWNAKHLRYASKQNDAWVIETVDSGNNTGNASSLILDGAGNPHISYLGKNAKTLEYAVKKDNNWQIKTIDTIFENQWYTATRTSINLDQSGNPRIVYFNQKVKDLKYTSKINDVWQIETVLSLVGDSVIAEGEYSHLVLDSLENAHISYSSSLILKGGSYVMQYARQVPGEIFVTKTTVAGAAEAKGDEKLVDEKDAYLVNNFVFSFLKLPKKLQAKKYYIKSKKFKKNPANYANAKKMTLKKYWKVTSNLAKYKAGKKKNQYSLRLIFAYDQSEFEALQKQNKKLKEKQLKLKYYNVKTGKWTQVPKSKQDTTRNFFYVTLKDYKFPLNTLFAIGK